MKILNDKYYTPHDLAKQCIDKTFEIIGQDNITEVIEPSAGNGRFSKQIADCIAYDIQPVDDSIIEQDFLKLEMEYKVGRLFIGNPPYGSRLSLARKFYVKCAEYGDYIGFILPIGQLNNTQSLYQFDLIYSEDLGKRRYTGRKLHCCFNLYRRPENGLNKRVISRLKDVTIVRQDSKNYDSVENHDLRMCYWGDGSAGKILKDGEKYAAEYKIIINNDELRDQIVSCFNSIDWHSELKVIAMLKIQQFHIVNALKKYVNGIR